MADYTLEDLEKGIRAADAAGDSEGVKALGAEYQRMIGATKAAPAAKSAEEYAMPEYAPPEGTLARIGRAAGEYAKERATKPSAPLVDTGLGIGEAGLSMATGTLASALGGIRGIANLAVGEPAEVAAQKVQETQQAMTYAPRTAAGKLTTEVAGAPLALASELGGAAGGAIGGLAGEKGRIAGEALGEFLPQAAATLLPGAQALRGARIARTRAEQIPIAGETYSPLRKLTPEQQERFAMQRRTGATVDPVTGELKGGMHPTLGSITREPEQMAFEQRMARTPLGEQLLAREEANNAALIQAVKNTDETYATRKSPLSYIDTGRSVLDALEAKKLASDKNVNALYEEAKAAGETKQPISRGKLNAFKRFLNTNKREIEAHPGTNAVAKKFEDFLEENKGVLTADDMEHLYKMSNRLKTYDNRYAMGQIKHRINMATENAGGPLYQQARFAKAKHEMEFTERKGIADLLERKTATDPKTATENVFQDTVIKGSLEELKDVSRSLLTTDNPALVAKGTTAVRELQHQTIDHILRQATKSATQTRLGQPEFSPAKFKQTIEESFGKAGKEKLEYLLGPEATRHLLNVSKSAIEAKTASGRMGQSRTSVDLLNDMARQARHEAALYLLEHVPAGRLARVVVEPLKTHRATKATQTGIEEALYPRRASPEETKQLAKAERGERKAIKRGAMYPMALPASAASEAAQEEERNRRPLEQAFQ